MTFTLRLWVKGKLEETLSAETSERPLARFRAIVAEWPVDWPDVQWYVTVNAEPGPYPAQSFPIALYQHPPTP